MPETQVADLAISWESDVNELALQDLDDRALLAEVETFLDLTPRGHPLQASSASLPADSRSGSETEGERAHTRHKSKAATKNFRYRQRLKGERDVLLSQQRELSKQLFQLQQRQKTNSDGTDSSSRKVQSTRERQGRVYAEEEQKNLVLAICTQANFIAKFSGTIHTQLDIAASHGPHKRGRLDTNKLCVNASGAIGFNERGNTYARLGAHGDVYATNGGKLWMLKEQLNLLVKSLTYMRK